MERKSPTPIATRSVIIAGGADSSNAGGSGADAPPATTAVATSQPTQTQQKNIDDASSPYKSSEEYELVEEWVWKGEWAFGNLPDDDDDGMSVGGKKTDAKKEDDANKNNEVTNTDIEARPDAPLLATADNELTNKSTTDSTAPNDMETDPNKNKSGGWLQKITSIITGAPGDEPKANETTTVTTPAALSSIGNDGSADAKNDENPDTAPAISDNATAKTNIKETHDKQKNRNATNDNNVSSNQTIKAMKPRPFSYRWQKPVEAKDIVIPSSLVGVVDEEDGENDATKVSGGERSESTEKKNEGSSHVSDGAAEAGNRGDGSEVATNMDVDREKTETNEKSSSREGDGTGDGTSKSANGGGENAAADAAPLSSSTAAADPSLATDTNNAPSGTAQQAENKNTENTTSTSKPSRTKMKRTFANPPFTDAGKAMSFGTCPQGGKWEGHFENVVPNATASKVRFLLPFLISVFSLIQLYSSI